MIWLTLDSTISWLKLFLPPLIFFFFVYDVISTGIYCYCQYYVQFLISCYSLLRESGHADVSGFKLMLFICFIRTSNVLLMWLYLSKYFKLQPIFVRPVRGPELLILLDLLTNLISKPGLGPNLHNFVKWTFEFLSQFFRISLVCQLISYRMKSLRRNYEKTYDRIESYE